MTDDVVRNALAGAERAGAQLRSMRPSEIAAILTQTAERTWLLANESESLDALEASTGLSRPMVRWALGTTFQPLSENDCLVRLAYELERLGVGDPFAVPPRLTAVWLASNVFTACVRALFVPLLSRSPVIAKAPRAGDTLVRLLCESLGSTAPTLDGVASAVTFEGGARSGELPLLDHADVLSIYGTDSTVQELRGRARAACRVFAHGHGLGAVWVPASAQSSPAEAEEIARDIALDVAAYDQRGCLSPHAVLVEPGGALTGLEFARRLSDVGLGTLEKTLPRGALPVEVGAGQVQWRAVAAVRGQLIEGFAHAVSYEGAHAIRLSPGWRNVAVHDSPTIEDALARLTPFGVHLKALGVAGPRNERERIAARLPPPLAPRVCAVGRMQAPPWTTLDDGEQFAATLCRRVQID